jgi:hypothetical protein
MDLLKNTRKTINEVNYLDLAKKRINFIKPCYSSEEALKFASKLANALGDEANSSTVTRWGISHKQGSSRTGRYLDSRSGGTMHGTFTWYYDPEYKRVSIDFKDAVGTHKPKYVYPKQGLIHFIAQIYTNERTGEIEVKYTTNKNEAYAIENNDKAIERFKDYMDSIGHEGKDLYFEDFSNRPRKVYKI